MASRFEPAYVEQQPHLEAYQQVGDVGDQDDSTQTHPDATAQGAVPHHAPSRPDTVVIVSQPVQPVEIHDVHVSDGGTTHLGTSCVILSLLAFIGVGIVALVPPVINIREEPINGTIYMMSDEWRAHVSYWTAYVDGYTSNSPASETDRDDWDGIPGLQRMDDDFRSAAALIITSMGVAAILILIQCLRLCGHVVHANLFWRIFTVFLWVAMVVFVVVAHGLTAKAVDSHIDEYTAHLTRTSPAASLSTRWAPGIVVYWVLVYSLLVLLLLYAIRTVVGLGSRCPCSYVPDPEPPVTPRHPHTD